MINTLLLIGFTLLLGLTSSYIFRKLKLPQILGHLIIGLCFGISVFNFFTESTLISLTPISQLALGLIGFIIGGELRWSRLKKLGFPLVAITCLESLFSFILVGFGCYLLTHHIPLSVILGTLAAASAPSSVFSIFHENRSKGPITNALFGVVGADDAFAILLFAFSFNLAKVLLIHPENGIGSLIPIAMSEISSAITLGIFMGIFLIPIIKSIRTEDIKQVFLIAAILICSGLAVHYELSIILCNLMMGITLCNTIPHSNRSFVLSLYKITPAIYIIFFVIVGAHLDLSLIKEISLIAVAYILLRSIGKISGTWIGGKLGKAPKIIYKNLGFCLLSQDGVAIGLALSVHHELMTLSTKYPEASLVFNDLDLGKIVISVIIITTLAFQIIGPLTSRRILEKTGELKTKKG